MVAVVAGAAGTDCLTTGTGVGVVGPVSTAPGAFATVNCQTAIAELPSVSVALTASVCTPSGSVVGSRPVAPLNRNGAVVALPRPVPSTAKSTWATLSFGTSISQGMIPATTAPLLIDESISSSGTAGGGVGGVGGGAWSFAVAAMASASSDCVSGAVAWNVAGEVPRTPACVTARISRAAQLFSPAPAPIAVASTVASAAAATSAGAT